MLGPSLEAPGSIAALVETYRAHGLFKRWPIDYLATRAALRSFLEVLVRERGAVVHMHTEATPRFWGDAACAALAIAARCPVIVHLHGPGFQRLYEGAGMRGAAIRWLFERAAYVLVPCEAMRTWVRGVARNARAVCLPSAVATLEASADGARPNLVLFLARLEPAQGIFDLVDALAGVRAAVPDVRLVCAGEGDRAAVARYAEQRGIADVVKFTGWAGPSAKRALLENAALFALPAYEEALPPALLEAMAAGIPAVVSPVGGLPEVVVDGVSGFFAAPGDVATLQRLLRRLLLDAALRERVGTAARESVRVRCAPERALARLGELYAGLGVHEWRERAAVHDPRAPSAAL